jgi:hypothetical protein
VVIIWSAVIFYELLQSGQSLLDVADLGGAQSHLQNTSRGTYFRAFAFALLRTRAQAVHGSARGRLEPHHGVLHGLPADFRQTLDDSRILQPPRSGRSANPHGLRSGFHAGVTQQGHDESLAQSRLFIAVPSRFCVIWPHLASSAVATLFPDFGRSGISRNST